MRRGGWVRNGPLLEMIGKIRTGKDRPSLETMFEKLGHRRGRIEPSLHQQTVTTYTTYT